MALCCIGGVCVPYSALLPLLAYAVKWVLEKLVAMGLLPKALEQRIGAALRGGGDSSSAAGGGSDKKRQKKQRSKTCTDGERSPCCNSDSTVSDTTATTTESEGSSASSNNTGGGSGSGVREIADEDDWEELMSSSPRGIVVIAKFTASWCRPCKEIHPFYASLAAESATGPLFVTVDADELDMVAAEHGVVMLPTFVVFKDGNIADRYSGSDQEKLRDLVQRNNDLSLSLNDGNKKGQ